MRNTDRAVAGQWCVYSFFVILIGLFATAAWSQTAPAQSTAPSSDSAVAFQGSTQTKFSKNARFLGWKFAAQTDQDTSRWQRSAPAEAVPATTVTTVAPTPTANAQASPSVGRPAPRALAVVGGGGSGGGNSSAFANAGFGFRAGLPTGYLPTSVVQGDFNEDGKMDMAIANGGDNTVYVLLGKGNGTFQVPEILYPQGASPVWITAARLTGSGHVDLVIADGDSKSFEVFRGNGDGTFGASAQFALPQTPTFVLAGDFNQDGKQDIAIGLVVDAGGIQQAQFAVALGDGAGGFSGGLLPPLMDGGSTPLATNWLASGDLNHDGYPDVVVTVAGVKSVTYLNQSGTAFAAGASFGPAAGPTAVELGDMDEDGCLDAVELDFHGLATIAKGACDGNFTQGSPAAGLGDLEPALRLVDVDGDGHLDVVGSAVNYGLQTAGQGNEAGYLVSVLKGDRHGNLGAARVYRGGSDAGDLIVADFTGDGRPEIVTISSSENRAILFTNNGSGIFDGAQGEAIGYTQGVFNSPNPNSQIEAADLNGDGKPDLLLVQSGADTATQPSVFAAMLNDGTGKFLAPVDSAISVGPLLPAPVFATGLFHTGALTPDVIYVASKGSSSVVAYFPGNGNGTFGAPVTLGTLPHPLLVATADFNNDGKLDFVVYGTDSTGAHIEADVFLGHGDGTFTKQPAQTFASANGGLPAQLFAVDVNHDGKLDLLIGNNENGGATLDGDDLIEALGNGDGTFQTPTTLIAHFGAVTTGDLNNDGFVDLVQRRDPSADVSGGFYNAAVTVYLGQANGMFQQLTPIALSGFELPSQEPLLIGDFNGDGKLDIGVQFFVTDPPTADASASNRGVRILQGAGDGTFTVTNHFYPLPAGSEPVAGADFNGDGALDLMELTGYTASFHTIPAAETPSVDITFDSSPLVGNSGSVTVTLDKPAQVAQFVLLTSSDPAVTVPVALIFSPGQSSQTFSFTLGAGFNAGHALAISASVLGSSETAVAYISKPNPNAGAGVSAVISGSVGAGQLAATTITPGQTLTLSFSLTSIGGYSGAFSGFQCAGLPAGVTCSFSATSLTVAAGGTASATLTIQTSDTTPFGTFPIQISATDGFFPAATTLTLGVGDFSLNVNLQTIVLGPTGSVSPVITSTATNGLSESLTLGCSGLPAGATCQVTGGLPANGSAQILISTSQVAPGDYPFEIVGSDGTTSHVFDAVLRVGDYNATLNTPTSAMLSAGQSATFSVTLQSLNHYANGVSVFCQSPAQNVTCTAAPVPFALTDSATGTVQIAVSVAAAPAARPATGTESNLGTLTPVFVLGLLGLGLAAVRRNPRLLMVIAVAGVFTVMVSCRGGGVSRESDSTGSDSAVNGTTTNVGGASGAGSTGTGSTGGGTTTTDGGSGTGTNSGAGSSGGSSGGQSGGSGGGTTPTVVTLSLTAMANPSAGDHPSQRTLGTIVVTIP